MTFILDKYIDQFIEKAEDSYDKRVAKHLKDIIPETNHLDQKVLKKIIRELRREMDNGKDFKMAFHKIILKYILKGDTIKAKLPPVLTRVILNKAKFISSIKDKYKIPFNGRRIEIILASGNMTHITRLLRKIKLSTRKVVFAAFDEDRKHRDPFADNRVADIIKMLALSEDVFDEDEPLTAVKIRYRNNKNFVKKYPTFIDAGWWDKFYPSSNQDEYGRTGSLDPSLPGMPEIVHKNIGISDVLEEIEFLEDKNGIGKAANHR
jgi:hypothetical protein